ncbi:MAG: Brp/Blh family beta-carotene 15,15'-dioxygenase [Pseudomonadota bacterium]
MPQIPLSVQIGMLAILISVFGLPHGALDAFLGRTSGLWGTPAQFVAFLIGYLAIAGAVIVIWYFAPLFSLSAFFIISAWHFGSDIKPQSAIERLAFGGAILSLPAFFSFDRTASLLQALISEDPTYFTSVLQVSALPLVGLTLLMVVLGKQHTDRKIEAITTTLALVLFAWLLPPLFYFVIYFCALHSMQHFKTVLRDLPKSDQNRAFVNAACLTFITVGLGAVAFVILRQSVTFDDAMLRVTFIGLAALTLPHMLLVDGLWRRRKAHSYE